MYGAYSPGIKLEISIRSLPGTEDMPLHCYSDEGWRVSSLHGVDGIRKYHRTVETYLNLVLRSGFTLTSFKDWAPIGRLPSNPLLLLRMSNDLSARPRISSGVS